MMNARALCGRHRVSGRHASGLTLRLQGVALAGAVALTMGLGGCASEGLEVEGTLLDTVGLSTSALNGSRDEPKIQDRATLVMPPSTALPAPMEPGSVQAAALDQQWPQDPETVAAARAAADEAQVKALCDDRVWAQQTKPEEFNRITDNGKKCPSLRNLVGLDTGNVDVRTGRENQSRSFPSALVEPRE